MVILIVFIELRLILISAAVVAALAEGLGGLGDPRLVLLDPTSHIVIIVSIRIGGIAPLDRLFVRWARSWPGFLLLLIFN